MSLCRFFLRNHYGIRCMKRCNEAYCYQHQNKIDTIQAVLSEHFSNESFRIEKSYKYLSFLSKPVLLLIIDYLYPRYYSGYYLNGEILPRNKKQCIEKILNIHEKLAIIHERYSESIIHLQRKFKSRKLNGPHEKITPINETDPFTLEPISEIDPSKLFSYKNDEGNVYAFSAYELLYHFETNGMLNPLNREIIPIVYYYKLRHYLKRLGNENIPIFENSWDTPKEAFIDVLHEYELHQGIYMLIEWFLNMSFTQVMNIFILFNCYINDDYHLSLFHVMELDDALNDNENVEKAQMALAYEMKKLIEMDHPMKMYFICSLFAIIGTVDKTIGSSLPSWVWMGSHLPD